MPFALAGSPEGEVVPAGHRDPDAPDADEDELEQVVPVCGYHVGRQGNEADDEDDPQGEYVAGVP